MVVGIMTGLVGMAGSLAAWSVREGFQRFTSLEVFRSLVGGMPKHRVG